MNNGFTHAPSDKAVKTLIAESESKNINMEHYKLIERITMQRISKEDVTYEINKWREVNEWGRPIHKLVKRETREVNKEISSNHVRWINELNENKKSSTSKQTILHVKLFSKFIKECDYDTAAIHYWSLPDKYRDGIKVKEKESNLVRDFLKHLNDLEDVIKQRRS